MAIRLYDSAWVNLDGGNEPQQVRKDRKNPAAFNVGGYLYDIDGFPMHGQEGAPRIAFVHNLQSAREAGLKMEYNPQFNDNF